MAWISCFGFSVVSVFFFAPGIHGQVTPPVDTTVALGAQVSLTCTSTETNPTFTWSFLPESQTLFFGDARGTTLPRYSNIDLQRDTDAQTSILIINGIELEEDGEYFCSTTTATTTPSNTMVTVEVASQSQPISLINIDDFANYQATCDAIGSKPEETITWVLAGVTQTDGFVETVETRGPLFDKSSVFTFPAPGNYNVTLTCQIGGHLLDLLLNREETRRVDVQNPPASEGIMVGFNSDRNQLTITCNTNEAVAASIPAMSNFFIYDSNNTLIHMSTNSVNSVTVDEPEQVTEYKCVGGNYLGNTSEVTNTYDPTSMTTPEPMTTDESTPESIVTEPIPCTCSLSAGASAGIAVLATLLLASIFINIIQIIVWRKQGTKSDGKKSQMITSSVLMNEGRETNDNMAYEMITSGERAYTPLKLGPSGVSKSPIIAAENVTFLTRLGSIGRGDFGGVWKGELRLNQDRASVAIRQLPDQVTKSTSVLQSIKVLCDLPDQPNIVKCVGYCQQQGSILYEFISGGTLLTHLQTTGVQSQPTYNNLKPNRVRVDPESLLNFAWQIAKGMQFLASKKIIHGNLCAHNVLLDERKQCKLADYGIASSLFNNRGKPTRWTSPETMVTGVPSTDGDIWSFGIVLWEIVTLGARPYPNMTFDIVRKEVANGYKMPRPRHCGQEVYDVMSLCWKKEGVNRSSFDQILKNLEKILEKNHNYLSLNDLDEGLYASTLEH